MSFSYTFFYLFIFKLHLSPKLFCLCFQSSQCTCESFEIVEEEMITVKPVTVRSTSRPVTVKTTSRPVTMKTTSRPITSRSTVVPSTRSTTVASTVTTTISTTLMTVESVSNAREMSSTETGGEIESPVAEKNSSSTARLVLKYFEDRVYEFSTASVFGVISCVELIVVAVLWLRLRRYSRLLEAAAIVYSRINKVRNNRVSRLCTS